MKRSTRNAITVCGFLPTLAVLYRSVFTGHLLAAFAPVSLLAGSPETTLWQGIAALLAVWGTERRSGHAWRHLVEGGCARGGRHGAGRCPVSPGAAPGR